MSTQPPTDHLSAARQKVSLPAMGLLITGIAGILMGLAQIVVPGVIFAIMAADKGLPHREDDVIAVIGVFGGPAAGGLCSLILSGIMVLAGARMKQLKSYGLSVIGAFAALLSCCGPFCYPLAFGVGIWALIVLNSADVKAAFDKSA